MIGQFLTLLTLVATAAFFSAALPSFLPQRVRIPVRSDNEAS